MTFRQQRQNQTQAPSGSGSGSGSAIDIAKSSNKLFEFTSKLQNTIVAQFKVDLHNHNNDKSRADAERLCRQLCDINVHRKMITHMQQVRNMQINRHRKLAYNISKLIAQKSGVAYSEYNSSCNYPEKACHVEMLRMHLSFVQEIKAAANSSIRPIVNHIALIIAYVQADPIFKN